MLGENVAGADFGALMRVPVARVAGFLAETARLAFEEDGGVELGHEKEGEDSEGEGPDGFDVFGPAPAEVGVGGEGGADDGANGGAADDADGVEGDSDAARFGLVEVAEGGGDVAHGRAAEDAAEEAGEQDGGRVSTDGRADAEETEADERGQDADSSPVDLCVPEGVVNVAKMLRRTDGGKLTSLIGAHSNGPKANPRTYKLMVRTTTSSLIPTSRAISGKAGAVMLEPRLALNASMPNCSVIQPLYAVLQFRGLDRSPASHLTRNAALSSGDSLTGGPPGISSGGRPASRSISAIPSPFPLVAGGAGVAVGESALDAE